MKKLFTLILICTSIAAVSQKKKQAVNTNKTAVIQSVDKHQQELISVSDKIWSYAETALRENKSAKELADYAEADYGLKAA